MTESSDGVIRTCSTCDYSCTVENRVDFEGSGETCEECTHPDALDYDLEEGQECKFWKLMEQEEGMDLDWRMEE